MKAKEFKCTSCGEIVIRNNDPHWCAPRSPDRVRGEINYALICQALNMRKELYRGGWMDRDDFDRVYLDDLSQEVRDIAKREGHEL